MRPQFILAMIATVVFVLVLGASAFDRTPQPMHSECHCCMVHSGNKKKAETKTVPGQKECSCCKDSCPMKKKDGSEKTGEMSCEKCECCKMKTDDHAESYENGPKANGKSDGDARCCDCPCCSPKDTTKPKGHEVITLALMNY